MTEPELAEEAIRVFIVVEGETIVNEMYKRTRWREGMSNTEIARVELLEIMMRMK